MNKLPLVTVIIPVYNSAKFLAEALDSVFAQTYHPLEVIIVDDGSTDDSAKIAKTYPSVRYLYQPNQGAATARNVGIASAEGELIALLDADDVWKPEKLSLQVEYLNQHPQIGILATKVYQFFESEVELPPGFRHDKLLGEQPGMIPSTLVIRKTVFNQIGVFSPEFVPSEDTEWLCRARDSQVEIAMLSEVLATHRLHGSNISWNMVSTSSSRLLKILKASIDRKSHQNR
ncbi:glycosyltransferase family 2 protein [Scytonema hofmannii FACHB-248]|uniref:Glycosyltransferase family 2 protein n=1 Tax=Scytonema hofmannii FACHB-248 TaxID=1842502 RepID=A0ABR8GJD3_9CYAN|nr:MULTISPECIES: glycosyltransferase family A protein [Nostocales]MBD2603495.1 glycosyltransferase family 2 protein [Scytonema hofmannii FACHB-248]